MLKLIKKLAIKSLLVSLILNRLATIKNYYNRKITIRKMLTVVNNFDWKDLSPEIKRQKLSFYDPLLMLITRILIEYHYDVVVELGASDGSRILFLKDKYPNVHMIGYDFCRPYQNGAFNINDVEFVLFDINNFSPPRKALVICNSTLNYFTPPELGILLEKLCAAKCDIAACEPIATYDNAFSTRRSLNAFYHPYNKLLQENGFLIFDKKLPSVRQTVNMKAMEVDYLFYAKSV